MWAQVIRVILANPIIFIVSSAVLFSLGAKIDLARITTPPARPVSPSAIITSAFLSSGLSPEESLLDVPREDSGSLESCRLATIQAENDLNGHQQEPDSSSEVFYSWPETLPVAEEPWNENSIALQGQSQSEFNGEFEDSTITLSSFSPSTTSVAGTGYFGFISYVGEYLFGDGHLDQSKLKSKSDAASSNEATSQSPAARLWDDFYRRTPSLNYLRGIAFFYLGLFLGVWIMYSPVKCGRKLVVEFRLSLLESRHKLLVESHKAATEKLQKEQETNEALNKKNEALNKKNEALSKNNEVLKTTSEVLKTTSEVLKKTSKALYKRNEQAYQELLTRDNELDRLEKIVVKISGGAVSTSIQELHESNEDMENLKEEVARLGAQNKDLGTRLGRESGKNAELKRRFDAAKAYAQELKEAVTALDKDAREAKEAKLQAIVEAFEARNEAETSRQAAETARLEHAAKFKEVAEAAHNETRIAKARVEAVISENSSLKRALAESEEKTTSVQKDAYAALASLEWQLNAEKLVKENLARDYERALALKTEAKVEATPQGFEISENSSVPVQPSGEAAVPTPVAEPQSSPAEGGLVYSSGPATSSNTSGQPWLKRQGFTMEVPRATSFPKYEPGLFGISFGKESIGPAQQKFYTTASCGGIENSKSDSMEASDSTLSSTNSSSLIFGTSAATLPTPFNVPDLSPTTAPFENPAAVNQQLGTLALQPDSATWVDSLPGPAYLQVGVTHPPSQDSGIVGAASFVGQDPNAVASQYMEPLLSSGGWNTSILDSMEASAPQASNTTNAVGFNTAAVDPPMEVDNIFDATIVTAFGNPVPINQPVVGDSESAAMFDNTIAIMQATPLPPPSQSMSYTGVSSTMNQQWETLQPLPNPGFGMSLSQEPSFVPNAVPMGNVAVQPLGTEETTLQQNQNPLFNWTFGSFTNVAPNPSDPFGSSQIHGSSLIPPTGPQLDNVAAEPNSLAVPLTLYPPTQSSPFATSPSPSFFNQAQGTGYITGSSPLTPNTNPSYVPTPPPSSLNLLAAPLFILPFDQIPGTTPINSSHTADSTIPFSAVVANGFTQSRNTAAADDGSALQQYLERDSESEEFEDVLASIVNAGTGDVIIPLSPRPIPASARLPPSSNALVASTEENTSSSGHATRGVPFGGRRQNEDEEDEEEMEGNFPPAVHIPRPNRAILPLPRSLRRAQDNGTRRFSAEGPVEPEATADEGDSSDAWGATDNDQRPSTPLTNSNGERTIRPLPRSRRRARAPVADQDANMGEQARLPEQDEGAWGTSSPLPTSPEGGSALHPSFGEYYRPPPVEGPDPEGPVWDSDQED